MMLVCDGGEGNSHNKMEEEACRDESCCRILHNTLGIDFDEGVGQYNTEYACHRYV